MAKVNLWELITTVASKDLPNSDKCKAIKDIIGPRFGSELSLEVIEGGVWVIEVFNHEDSLQGITLTISPNGYLIVNRRRDIEGIIEKRSVAF